MKRIAVLLSLVCIPWVVAQEPSKAPAQAPSRPFFRFPEHKFAGGELKYFGKTPVLFVSGNPEEIGRQIGDYQAKTLKGVQDLIEDYVKYRGWNDVYPWLLKSGSLLTWNFPADHRREFDAAAKAANDAAKVDRNMLVFINTGFDLVSGVACSTIGVEPKRSATGELMLGRNLDLPPFAYLHELTMVTIYRPTGKRAFASIGFPGVFGVITGMNDTGLVVAVNEIVEAKDPGVRYNPLGTPKLLLLRRVLEECATVEEAEKLLRSAARTGMMAVTACDPKESVVFEVTAKAVVRRPAVDGMISCTNHFRSKELCVDDRCVRIDHLEMGRKREKLNLEDVADRLHAARFGDLTMQTMIFEPAKLRLHLAFGKLPSSSLPRETIDLGPLLKSK